MATKPLISFRTDPEINEELKARAAQERRTLAQLVANLVADHLAAEKARQRSAA
jgi:hypothetical protein